MYKVVMYTTESAYTRYNTELMVKIQTLPMLSLTLNRLPLMQSI